MNSVENICGLIVQLPLPKHLDKQAVMNAINPDIDVDMITSVSLGELFYRAAKNYASNSFRNFEDAPRVKY